MVARRVAHLTVDDRRALVSPFTFYAGICGWTLAGRLQALEGI
jgi:hypothetical protein